MCNKLYKEIFVKLIHLIYDQVVVAVAILEDIFGVSCLCKGVMSSSKILDKLQL